MASSRKIILSSILGNALEFYDFTLYGVFAAVIANHYFPGEDDAARLLSSLAAFAVGFLTRPLGAIIFGHIGDIVGRKQALSFSVLLMGIPTCLIGICPSYKEIGLYASILIFACRLLQGIFTGGEYNGAAIFSIEHLGKKKPGLIGGLVTGSCAIGAFMATLLGAWSQGPDMPHWGWRLPFILGGIFGIFGFFLRRHIEETPEYVKIHIKSKIPLLMALVSNPKSSLLSFAFGSFNGALTYTLFGFLNIYLARYLDVPIGDAMKWNLLGLFAFMIGSPIMGSCMDHLGKKNFLIGSALSIFTFAIPIFLWILSKQTIGIIAGQVLLGLCSASIAGTGHAVMQASFPVQDRYSGVAFNFSLGMGIFGGMTPMIYIRVIEKQHGSLLFPAFFLMGLSVLFSLSLFYLKDPQNELATRKA